MLLCVAREFCHYKRPGGDIILIQKLKYKVGNILISFPGSNPQFLCCSCAIFLLQTLTKVLHELKPALIYVLEAVDKCSLATHHFSVVVSMNSGSCSSYFHGVTANHFLPERNCIFGFGLRLTVAVVFHRA